MPYLALLRVARWLSLCLGQEGMAGVLSLALSYTQASVSRPLHASPFRFLGLFQNIQEKIFVTNQLWAQPHAGQTKQNKKPQWLGSCFTGVQGWWDFYEHEKNLISTTNCNADLR